MNGWIVVAIVAVVIVVGAVAQRRGWIDLSDKTRRSGGSGGAGAALGIGDEVFNPTRHEAQIELDRQTVLPAPAPLPGDGGEFNESVYRGRVQIDLSRPRG